MMVLLSVVKVIISVLCFKFSEFFSRKTEVICFSFSEGLFTFTSFSLDCISIRGMVNTVVSPSIVMWVCWCWFSWCCLCWCFNCWYISWCSNWCVPVTKVSVPAVTFWIVAIVTIVVWVTISVPVTMVPGTIVPVTVPVTVQVTVPVTTFPFTIPMMTVVWAKAIQVMAIAKVMTWIEFSQVTISIEYFWIVRVLTVMPDLLIVV